MSFGNRTRAVLATTVLASAASGFLSGCGDDQQSYCVAQDGTVLDDCAGHPGSFIYLGGFGGHSYRVGDRIPPRYLSGGDVARVNPGDAAARRAAGLSGTGKIATGGRVSGGIGKGGGGGSKGG